MDLVDKLVSEEDQKLLRRSEIVDNIDKILGPLTSTMQLFGGPALMIPSIILNYSELLFVKAPFMIEYVKKTNDYDALVWWIPKEIFANTVPYGNFIDVIKSYRNRTRKYFEKKIEEEKEYLINKLKQK